MTKQVDEDNTYTKEPAGPAEGMDDGQDLLGEGESSLDTSKARNIDADIGQTSDKVSSNNIFLIVAIVIALVAGVLIYFWLKAEKQPQVSSNLPLGEKAPTKARNIPMPTLGGSSTPDKSGAISAPPPPPAPKVVAPALPPPLALPTPAPPPAPQQQLPAPPKMDLKQQEATSTARASTKLKSSIMLKDGGAAVNAASPANTLTLNTASGDFIPGMSTSSNVRVSTVGDMSITIAQGKILDAVLETPVNTKYPGPVRALISRDVFSDRGSNVLIPKGSRLIGSLSGGYTPGSTRLMIQWTRIIMPSGNDINVSGFPAVGPSGMVGVEGEVDRQLMETLGSAALLSLVNISTAKVIQDKFKIPESTSTSTTTAAGSTRVQSTQTPVQQSAQEAFQKLSDMSDAWIKQNFAPTPYIVLDQGTRVKVFVNQDIRFPKNINAVQPIQ